MNTKINLPRREHLKKNSIVLAMRTFLRAHRGIAAIVAGGVALRLAQYAAPSALLLPNYFVDGTMQTFLLTNVCIVAATLALFGLGRELDGPHTGIVAAMLFTVSPLIVYYGRFHAQQAAAVAAMIGAVLCGARWLRNARGALGAAILALATVVLGGLALALDYANLHLLAAIAIVALVQAQTDDKRAAAAGRCSGRSWWQLALLLAAVIVLAMPLRTFLLSGRDLWAPSVPAPRAIAVDGVTLAILWDRLTVLLLPGGGTVLLALGLLYVRRWRDAIVPLWAVAAALICIWTANRHLAHGVVYVSLVAVLSLAAGRGAAIVLAAGGPRLVRRNLATLAVVALVFSTAYGEGYAFARIRGWNTAFVADRQAVPLPWIDRLRAHGAWYFMSSARSLDRMGDRELAEEMQATYGSTSFEHYLLFPIFRTPAANYQLPGQSRLPLLLEAEERPTHLGRIVFDPHADNGYAVRSNREGFVLQGPYLEYPAGEYVIDFRVRAAPSPEDASVVGHVDVAQRRAVVAQTPVDLAALPASGYGRVQLTVSLPRTAVTEFRFFGYGTHTVWLDNIRIRPPASQGATP